MLKWVDATSYARGERGKVEPRTWKLYRQTTDIEFAGIKVTRHIDYPGMWMYISSLIPLNKILTSSELEDAKLEAINLEIEATAKQIESLEKWKEDLQNEIS